MKRHRGLGDGSRGEHDLPPASTPPVVMILESARDLRRMLEDGLEQQGYLVTSAATPGEALEVLRRTPADLLIADRPTWTRTRPDPELETLHREFPGVPAIVVSEEAFEPEMLAPPPDGHAPWQLLPRPFTLGALLRLTARLLDASGEQHSTH